MKGPVTRRSYWLEQALSSEPGWHSASPTLEGRRHADVCIVGGGFTGLWTAVELRQRDPSLSIALIEADVCGAGASGTNAGYLMNLWPKFLSLQALAGQMDGTRLAQQSSEAVTEIIDFVEREGIDAGLMANGWLWGSTNPFQDASWAPLLAQLEDVPGSPLQALDAQQATDLAGAPVRGGVLDPGCAILQPARLARGLRRWLIEHAVLVFEGSRMTRLRSDRHVRVMTARGEVVADSAILAVNAWAMAFPQVRRHMLLTASDNVVLPIPTDTIDRFAAAGVGVSDSGRLLNYWRTTVDGHLLFGKGGLAVGYGAVAADTLFAAQVNDAVLRDRAQGLFPDIPYKPVSSWRAPVEYSLSSLPFFVPLEGHPRVHLAAGYSGDGVGPSRLGAKILASLALGTDDEWSASPLTRAPTRRLPPEPVRFIGGQVVAGALKRQDSHQAHALPTDKATELLTRLDPTSWVT